MEGGGRGRGDEVWEGGRDREGGKGVRAKRGVKRGEVEARESGRRRGEGD